MSEADVKLMTAIRAEWGGAIEAACRKTAVPPAFLAALVAGESGGNPNAQRFERAVLADLWQVLMGREKAYGSIVQTDLTFYVYAQAARADGVGSGVSAAIGRRALLAIDGLATSYGLTQIMGWQILAGPRDLQAYPDTAALADPARNLSKALQLLAQFAVRFRLDLAAESAELLHCWNTGQPDKPTADPAYVPNGLQRMAIYGQLPPMSISA